MLRFDKTPPTDPANARRPRMDATMFAARAAFAIALFAAPPAVAATVEDWRADIDAMTAAVERIHPNAFTKVSRAAWEGDAGAMKAALTLLTEEQRVVRAMRWIASIGDGHTQLAPRRADFALWYPVRIYPFRDGIFVTSAFKGNADLAGAQVLRIAGRPAAQVAGDARSLMGADNGLLRIEQLHPLHNAVLMRGMGYANADGSLPVTVRLANGRTEERVLRPMPVRDVRYDIADSTFEWRFAAETIGPPLGTPDEWTTAYRGLTATAFRTADNTRPAHFTQRRGIVARAMPERDAYYIQANFVGNPANETFEAFFRRALGEVDAQRPKSLIVDIRYNSGGDGSKLAAMIHQFIKREDNPPWKECYLLTGRKTFSAAVMFAITFNDHLQCSIVGEPPGAAFNSFGDATTAEFPRTGLVLNVSTVYHQLDDSGSNDAVIPVDVPAPFSFAEWSSGADPAIDAILRGDEMRSLGRIALDKGGVAAIRVYRDRLRRYPQYAAWFRPREIDLIKIGWRLMDREDKAGVLAVYGLLAELYPNSAKAIGRYGDAQIAMGDTAGGLASYRRALALDPYNLDNLGQRQALFNAAFDRPAEIKWGATVAAIERALRGKCTAMRTRRIDPPFLDNIRDRQMQIDCDGFDFAGAPRDAEYVFGDDALKMVWILTGAADQNRILAAMQARFGEITKRNANYIAFEKANAALRLDKPEVLFYAPELAASMASDFAP